MVDWGAIMTMDDYFAFPKHKKDKDEDKDDRKKAEKKKDDDKFAKDDNDDKDHKDHKKVEDKVVAEDDKFHVKEGHKLKGNVLDNDTKGHDLDVVWYSQPKHGKLWLDKETGKFKYKAYEDKDKYDEKDYFLYKVKDKYGNYDIAKVYIKIKDDDHKGHHDHSHDYYMT